MGYQAAYILAGNFGAVAIPPQPLVFQYFFVIDSFVLRKKTK